MNKKVLIIDDNPDRVEELNILFKNVGFAPLNSKPVTDKIQVLCMMDYHVQAIVLLDHNISEYYNGLDIAQSIIKKHLLCPFILSTSNEAYRKCGISHFPEKNFLEIMKCINGKCSCFLI